MQGALTPPGCDLQDFPRMMIDIPRLFGSEFDATATDAEWRCGVTLWLKSFHQVPAASLPDDDVQLARLCGLGRDVKSWRKIRAGALRGWIAADDGRLYHPFVAEIALEAWLEKLSQRLSSGAGNAARWGTEFDPEPIKAEIGATAALLASLNPKSKALAKQQVAQSLRKSRRDTHSEIPTGRPVVPTGSQEKGREEIKDSEANASSVASAAPTATTGSLALAREDPTPSVSGEPWERDVDFGKLWDMAPPLMRRRAKSKAKVWPEWVKSRRRAVPAAILGAFGRYKAMDADLPRSGGPGLHIWLRDRTFEQWFTGGADADPTAAWTDAQWTVALRIWRDSHEWGEQLGPPPGSPGCRAPARLLVQAAQTLGGAA